MKNKLQKLSLLGLFIGYIFVMLIIWMNEIFDLPHLIFNAPTTPINWEECLIESTSITLLFILNASFFISMFSRIKLLEGLLPVCCVCKKIRTPSKEWVPIESYIEHNSEADFTHGVCPECKNSSNWL